MRRHYCTVCHGYFPGRDGYGFMFWWKCNRCRSLLAAEKRAEPAPTEAMSPPRQSPRPESRSTSKLPPPGWMRDPDDPNGERWWDGTDWTDHTR